LEDLAPPDPDPEDLNGSFESDDIQHVGEMLDADADSGIPSYLPLYVKSELIQIVISRAPEKAASNE